MKNFKKIICGAIVFCLMLATCVGVTGCFGKKEKGLSAEEKTLRDNAIVVIDEFFNYGKSVNELITVASEAEWGEDYLYYCDRYVGIVEITLPMAKMLIENKDVQLGKYYEYSITDESTKIRAIMSVDISSNNIEIDVLACLYDLETNEQVGSDNLTCILEYDGNKAISLLNYSSEGFYKLGRKYAMPTTTGTIFDSIEEYSYDNEDNNAYFDYNYFEGTKNAIEHIKYETFDDASKTFFIKFLECMDKKLINVDLSQNYKSVPQNVEDLFDEKFAD